MEASEAFRAAFEFHRRWLPCPRTPEGWAEAAAEMGRICVEAGNDPFLMDLLVAVYSDLERRYDERKTKKGVSA